MATILNIETSCTPCSVALTSDGMILHHREALQGRSHATLLSGFLQEALDAARRRDIPVDAVAVSIGPGSYTGLRIGLSQAKGLAYALKVPLIGVETLKLLATAAMFRADLDPDSLLAPMIDARRMEVYTAVYDFALAPRLTPRPLILGDGGEESPVPYGEYLEQGPVVFVGDAVAKAERVIRHPAARFVHGIEPLATDMLALAEQAVLNSDYLDLAYCTPLYLKDFQATRPRPLF